MFDYEMLKKELIQQMKKIFDKWLQEQPDIYIFSLDCTREMNSIGVIANTCKYLEEQELEDAEDYWYYKYCEDEWELFHTFEDISAEMKRFLTVHSREFIDFETCKYKKEFENHCNKMIQCCLDALLSFRQQLGEKYADILLTLNIREYFDAEERIKVFEELNSKVAVKEYVEHIEEFV